MPRSAKSKVTIRTVADLAGVSVMSVSNVLNGRSVRPATRDAVLRAVKALDFQPNIAARQLRSATTPVIGMLQDAVDHPFANALFLGALMAAARHGAQLLPHPIDYGDTDAAWAAIPMLRGRGARALLISPSVWFAMSKTAHDFPTDLPIITVAPPIPPVNIASVCIDEQGAARAMTEMLIHKGHRRIGFVRAPEYTGVREARFQGYLDALGAHGIGRDSAMVVDGSMGLESGISAGLCLLERDQPPTAIFASNDDMAAGVIVAAHMKNLKIPHDVAIAGFDGGIICEKIWPKLTSVYQPVLEMAEIAVHELVNELSSDPGIIAFDRSATYVDYQIIERASTDG